MANVLYLEKRGCDFFHGDPIETQSDVGNYRVFMRFTDHNGVEVCGDICRGDVYRYTHKTTGKPLKHRKFEHSCGMFDMFQYTEQETGRTFRYRLPQGCTDGLRYTLKDILTLINRVSCKHYDVAEVVDRLPE